MTRGFSCVVAALAAGLTLAACTTGGAAPSSGRSITPAANSASPVSPAPVTTTTARPSLSGGDSPRPASPSPSVGTGITGQTVADGCPVMRDPPCPDKPGSAHLSVIAAATGSVVTTVDSGTDGRFSVAVNPGQYLLRLGDVGGALPRQANPIRVTVERGRYTTVTVRLDSGIR